MSSKTTEKLHYVFVFVFVLLYVLSLCHRFTLSNNLESVVSHGGLNYRFTINDWSDLTLIYIYVVGLIVGLSISSSLMILESSDGN